MSRNTGEGNTAYLNNGNHKTELREKHVALNYGSRKVKTKQLSTYLNEST